jgi:hypothetical protein
MMLQDPLHVPRARPGPIRPDQVNVQECGLTLHPAQCPHVMHTRKQGLWSVSDSIGCRWNQVQSCLRSRLNRVVQRQQILPDFCASMANTNIPLKSDFMDILLFTVFIREDKIRC